MRPCSRTFASRMREVSPLASGRASGFSWKLMFLPAFFLLQATFHSPRVMALYLVSKGALRGSAIRLYRVDRGAWSAPDTTFDVVVATLVQTLDIRPSPEAGRVVTAGAIRQDGRLVALRTYSEIYLFYPGVGGRLLPAREHACSIAGLEIGGEAIDFLDDSTFVLTSEASGRRRGRIDTVTCSP